MNGKLRNMTSVFLFDKDGILCLYRIGSKVANEMYVGSAGGHFEQEELSDARACALRELREETGLHARLIAGKKAISEYDIPPYTRKQVVLFLGEVEGKIMLQEAEVQNYQWVKAEELPAYLHPDTYQVCRELLR